MRAVVLRGRCDIAVEEVPDPEIEAPGDAIVAVTSSALCGSDLHMIEGRIGPDAGLRLGHEPLGVVTEVGSGVSRVRPGQRVVAPTHLFCGTCDMCARGYSAACLRVNPGRAGAAYGYAGMGGYPGGHAEYLRVPFADTNLVTLPGEPGDGYEDDFVLLADAFVTGWHATELAEVAAGRHGGGLRGRHDRAARRARRDAAGGAGRCTAWTPYRTGWRWRSGSGRYRSTRPTPIRWNGSARCAGRRRPTRCWVGWTAGSTRSGSRPRTGRTGRGRIRAR